MKVKQVLEQGFCNAAMHCMATVTLRLLLSLWWLPEKPRGRGRRCADLFRSEGIECTPFCNCTSVFLVLNGNVINVIGE